MSDSRTDRRTVLLGVTGCIAAYKACEILRDLQKSDISVNVVMTKEATNFVGLTTFEALVDECAYVDNFDNPTDPIPHISLAEGCDLMLIAPCTANVLAKLANGIADDLLTSTALAASDIVPIMIAPAMNVHMYRSKATQANLAVLRERGFLIVEPDDGYLACGDIGEGKLASHEEISASAIRALDGMAHERDLYGKRVMITAGPTIEDIDPVRFISNRSTGKMGYSIAQAAAERGADVCLISGPVSLEDPEGVRRIAVRSTQEMLDACLREFPSSDIAIFSAAVSDFRPASYSQEKMKKGTSDEALSNIELVENPDIVKTLSKLREEGQKMVAFAAETNDVVSYGKSKLKAKGVDAIVANDVSDGKSFGRDSEKAWIITENSAEELPELSKYEIANKILDATLKC